MIKKNNILDMLKVLGPGFAVAATGVGAGDMIAAAVSGAKYGTVILWAAVFGAVIKYVLNDGIARWQLSTGTTLLEGWARRLPGAVSLIFIVYLVLWSFIVAGALISACGLAAHAIFPSGSVAFWGIVHSAVGAFLVFFGRYALFERLMKIFIGMMFTVVMTCAFLVKPDWSRILPSLTIPVVPEGSGKFILGVIGGVGGSVTLLNYGYWIREKGWTGEGFRRKTQVDLLAAYLLTGLFGVAIMIIAAGVNPGVVTGSKMALEIANQLETIIGPVGKGIFLVGFWGAVFTSLLGVWQGVPYIFTDFMLTRQHTTGDTGPAEIKTDSFVYRAYLFYLAFPPMLLLYFQRPVWIIVIYSVASALFMPFLAGTLLYMNNRKKWVKNMKNGWLTNLLICISLGMFSYVFITEIVDFFK